MTETSESYFSVDSRLLLQLGEKLVTDRAVALAELVKNSYDADATYVKIEMQRIKAVGGQITVKDNGTGMQKSIFDKTWMRIATIDKEQNPISNIYNRRKAGEKGIGRFACRRLSSILEIESISQTTDNKKQRLIAAFNWGAFVPGSDVNGLPVQVNTQDVDAETSTGTILRLINTTEAWTAEDIRRLKYELADLISPISIETEITDKPKEYDPGFKIDIICSEFPTEIEPLDKTFFKNAWAKLSARIDSLGFASYKLKTTPGITPIIDRELKKEEPFKHIHEVKMEINIFSYRSEYFYRSEWRMGQSRKIGEEFGGIKVYADNFRVFGYGTKGDDWLSTVYDRARSVLTVSEEASPLADEGTRPGLSLFRNNNMFGHVTFSRSANKSLEITVNRERLINNVAYEELRKFARLGVDFATVLYSNVVAKEQKEKEARKIAHENAIRKAIADANTRIEDIRKQAETESRQAEAQILANEKKIYAAEESVKAIIKKREDIRQDGRSAEEQIREIEKNLKQTQDKSKYLEQLRSAVEKQRSLLIEEEKILKEEFAELQKYRDIQVEVNRLASLMIDSTKNADEKTKKAQTERQEAEEEEIRLEQERLQKEYVILRVLASTGTLILIFEHELQALVDDMEEMFNSALDLVPLLPETEKRQFDTVLESFGNRKEMIKELGNFLGLIMGLESRAEKREWVISPIIDQVFRPFVWYLKDNGIDHNNMVPNDLRTPRMYRSELVSVLHNLMSNAVKAVSGRPVRLIGVKGWKDDSLIHVQFLDTGKGIPKARWERAFEPFESDSEPDIKFGVGTGLGLKIVRDIVRSYGGEIEFHDPPEDWVTCVEFTLQTEDLNED